VREDASGHRVGRIVEVEAYGGPDDRASHARSGLTSRTSAMFGPPGHAYVYLVYGMYDCLNVVTGTAGAASAVLIRAVAPIRGSALMRTARLTVAMRRRAAQSAEGRRRADAALARTPEHGLARGPGLVAAAFGIDTSWTGLDLCDGTSPLRLEVAPPVPANVVRAGPRVGIGYAGPEAIERPWRLWLADEPAVSGRTSIPRSR
jgi:DNA-3-methyladenine glycosylase